MKIRILLPILITSLLLIPSVSAHSGRTDSSGCHNCYTSYCYGEYHCHGGGSYVAPQPRYTLPIPQNPKSGNWEYEVSSQNWCNYDLVMTWGKPISGDRFSVAASKYAGADPGPLSDTMALSYTFKNLTPGRWYVNIKTGNSERWASNITYWTLDLPKPTPALNAYIIQSGDSQYLKYDLTCLDKVQGPQEFIDYLKSSDNTPSGQVKLNYSTPTTIKLTGWDLSKKEYVQEMAFTPLIANLKKDQSSKESSSDSSWVYLILGGGLIWGIYSFFKSRNTKSLQE
jgi:hypothetical protein